MTDAELAWFFTGTRRFFPELWEPLMQRLCEATHNEKSSLEHLNFESVLSMMHILLDANDPVQINDVLRLFGEFEEKLMTLLPRQYLSNQTDDNINIARIEHHYFQNNRAEASQLLEKLQFIQHLPCIIVQGRYDMICPPFAAFQVKQRWPQAELIIVPNGGHSGSDPAIKQALLEATEEFKGLI